MGDERTVTNMDREIGLRIRARRIEVGMSQAGLAEKLGLTFQQIQKYETGTNRIAATRLFFIAQELAVCPLFLLTGTSSSDGAITSSNATAMLATPDGASLANAFAGIVDPKVRKRLVQLAVAVAEDAQVESTGPTA